MDKKNFGFWLISLFLFLAAPLLAEEIQEAMPSTDKPVITQSFASTGIKPGDTWKVYLKATCPNGEMKNIYAVVSQPGVGEYPMNVIPIIKKNHKAFSGYLYLVTSGPWKVLEFVNINLTIWVQDKSGNFSEPVIFPLSFRSRASQEVPSQGIFQEQDLGAILVRLKSSPRG